MDSQKLQNLGWRPNYSLVQGLELTYDDFLKNSNLKKNNAFECSPSLTEGCPDYWHYWSRRLLFSRIIA